MKVILGHFRDLHLIKGVAQLQNHLIKIKAHKMK
jgi:hypothetical protein